MSFDADLDTRLRNRLAEIGPIDIQLTQREYQYLRSQVRLFWNENTWSSEECARFLLFMRGYSFFREIDSSREREFWSNFFRELELSTENSKPNYSEINKALQKNQITNPLIQHGGGNFRTRTEYVQTFESIWGIRSLNAANLEKLFRRYYFQDLQVVDETLIRKLLTDTPEDGLQRAVRQSASYDRIFVGLKAALDFVRHDKIQTEPLETLTSRLSNLGFEFSDPNPIDFFRNKAEKALRNLLGQLRGETRVLQNKPKRIKIQEEFEDDEDTSGQKRTRTEFQVEVQYSKNTHEHDSPVNLEYENLPSGSRVLQLTGATQKEIRFEGNTVGFFLEIGETLAQVIVGNEPVTRAERLFCLPKLEWSFFDHRGETLKSRPIEGRTLIAEVRLPHENDGRYARQRWHAKWDTTGEMALPFAIQFDLDEHRIEAFLHTEPYGVRLFDSNHLPMDGLTHVDVQFQVLPKNLSAQHRVLFASQPEQTANLENWAGLRPETEDELIVERNLHKDWWEAVGRFPIRQEPVVHCCELHGGVLELHASTPHGAIWRIIEMNQLEHSHEVSLEPQQVALRHPKRFATREVVVRLECGSYTSEQCFTFIPNPVEWLESELQFGIGWGQL